jgi:hypothetical protein
MRGLGIKTGSVQRFYLVFVSVMRLPFYRLLICIAVAWIVLSLSCRKDTIDRTKDSKTRTKPLGEINQSGPFCFKPIKKKASIICISKIPWSVRVIKRRGHI